MDSFFFSAMTSKTLNLDASNATNQLYQSYSNQGLIFRHVDLDILFKDTPLIKLHENNQFMPMEYQIQSDQTNKEIVKSVHLSDAIRIILIFKYGGWYSDLDMVIIKPLTELQNVLSCDEFPDIENHLLSQDFLGKKVSNAIFHFEKEHSFLKKCIENFASLFDGTWGSGGPNLFQVVLNNLCQIDEMPTYLSNQNYTPESCDGVTVLKYR